MAILRIQLSKINFALNEKVSPKYYHSYFDDYFIIIILWNEDWESEMKFKLWSSSVFLNLWHVQHFSEILAKAYRENGTVVCPKDFLYNFVMMKKAYSRNSSSSAKTKPS